MVVVQNIHEVFLASHLLQKQLSCFYANLFILPLHCKPPGILASRKENH